MIKVSLIPPQHQTQFLRMREPIDADASGFYLHGEHEQAFRLRGTPFRIEATAGTQLEIRVNKGLPIVYIMTSASDTVVLKLARGLNIIVVFDPATREEDSLTIVAADHLTMLEGIAREMYLQIWIGTDAVDRELRSPWASKANEFRLPWVDSLPNTDVARKLAVRLSVKSMVAQKTVDRGVIDFLTALTYNTPIHIPGRELVAQSWKNPETIFEPIVYHPISEGMYFSGIEMHSWLPDICRAELTAFLKLIGNMPQIFNVREVGQEFIRLDYFPNNQIQTHRFSLNEFRCTLEALNLLFQCLNKLRVIVIGDITSELKFCLWGFPFDMLVDNPLCFDTWDKGVFLDSGRTFDTGCNEDPFTSDWLGISLSDRWDGGHCLDSYIRRPVLLSGPNPCCWDGPPVTPLNSGLTDETFVWTTSAGGSLTITP